MKRTKRHDRKTGFFAGCSFIEYLHDLIFVARKIKKRRIPLECFDVFHVAEDVLIGTSQKSQNRLLIA